MNKKPKSRFKEFLDKHELTPNEVLLTDDEENHPGRHDRQGILHGPEQRLARLRGRLEDLPFFDAQGAGRQVVAVLEFAFLLAFV